MQLVVAFNIQHCAIKIILDFAEADDDGVAVAFTGPYASHLHLVPDRKPC